MAAASSLAWGVAIFAVAVWHNYMSGVFLLFVILASACTPRRDVEVWNFVIASSTLSYFPFAVFGGCTAFILVRQDQEVLVPHLLTWLALLVE